MTGIIDPLGPVESMPDAEVGPASGIADLERVRNLVLRAHPEVVPELVQGTSVTELLASIEPAQVAYAELALRIRGAGAAASDLPVAPVVPAGGAGPVPIDLERIPTAEKLRRGIEQRGRIPAR